MTVTIKKKSAENPAPDAEPTGRESPHYYAPYWDLDSSIEVANTVYNQGTGACTPDQLAHWLGYVSVRSGTFLTRVAAPNKHYGLIQSDSQRFTITERGRNIVAPVMPEDAVNARIDAFLAVPLFARLYADFRGRALPPRVGLLNLFTNTYRMRPDRAAAVLRIFMSAAQQSGMLHTDGDQHRLIRPAAAALRPAEGTPSTKPGEGPAPTDTGSPAPEKPRFYGGGGGDGPGIIHGALIALLRDLPPPGNPWPPQRKQRFLEAFKASIDFIYPEEEA